MPVSLFPVSAWDVQTEGRGVILLKDTHPTGISGVRGIIFPVPLEWFSWFLRLARIGHCINVRSEKSFLILSKSCPQDLSSPLHRIRIFLLKHCWLKMDLYCMNYFSVGEILPVFTLRMCLLERERERHIFCLSVCPSIYLSTYTFKTLVNCCCMFSKPIFAPPNPHC